MLNHSNKQCRVVKEMILKPNENEYLPLVKKYIDLVTEGDIISTLRSQNEHNLNFLFNLSEEQGNFRYAPEKWSIKEVIGHIADVERLWQYRILRIARNDIRELPGYDRDVFVTMSGYDNLSLFQVLNDYAAVRNSTITLVSNLSNEAVTRLGEFNNHALSVRAAIYIIAGHETHHINIIKSKYIS